jgi:RNA polymerase sigma factor (sigma-70 family)
VEDNVQLSTLAETLSDREVTILRLRFWEEMSQSQIADQVGVSQVQVSRLLRSITRTLRERQN